MEDHYNIDEGVTDRTTSSNWNSDFWTNSSSSTQNAIRRRRCAPISTNAYLAPAFNACVDCPESNVDSSLLRYTRSRRIPSSSSSSSSSTTSRDPDGGRLIRHLYNFVLGNSSWSSSTSPTNSPTTWSLQLYKTPVKMEEDVLVMDGILLKESSGSYRTARSSSEIVSYSSSNNTSNGSGDSLYRAGFGSKAQVQDAYGKDELRGLRLLMPEKPVPAAAYSTMYGVIVKYPPASRVVPPTAGVGTKTAGVTLGTTVKTFENNPAAFARLPPQPAASSPFEWPQTEEEVLNALFKTELNINEILCWPGRGRRLPVFRAICPDE